MNIIEKLRSKVIVSVQAMPNEPLYEEVCMLAMMKSVIKGGAAGLRVAGERDVKNAKKFFNVPVIGITKPDVIPRNWREIVYITPTMKDVALLIEAGADIIAFDGTMRKRPGESTLEKIIKQIKLAKKLSMADISTVEEGLNAAKLGADILSTTLSGYTLESSQNDDAPDFKLLEELVKKSDCTPMHNQLANVITGFLDQFLSRLFIFKYSLYLLLDNSAQILFRQSYVFAVYLFHSASIYLVMSPSFEFDISSVRMSTACLKSKQTVINGSL